MTNSIDNFRRHVRAATGIYSRIDKGQLTGRNAKSTDDNLRWHIEEAQLILSAACISDDDPLPEYLDRNTRLAESWRRVERRWVGARLRRR